MTTIDEKLWTRVVQEAGPEVRVVTYKYHSRKLARDRAARRRKEDVKQATRDCWCRKTKTDKIELYLACIGWHAKHYVLTYEAIQDPAKYGEVQKDFDRFRRAVKRRRGDVFAYLYAVEGLHGEAEWHVHIVVDSRELTYDDLMACWCGGGVREAQPQISKRKGGFRGLAKYLTKEPKDGKRKPLDIRGWGVARVVKDRLPPPVRSQADSPVYDVPDGSTQVYRSPPVVNEFGEYRYVTYLRPRRKGHARAHATLT